MMQIVREAVPTSTLAAFADQHGLVLLVKERKMDRWQRSHGLPRFLAYFDKAEVKEGGVLRGVYGDGNTEEEAIRHYAAQISCERLVIDAFGQRREIDVPRLTGGSVGTDQGQREEE